MTGCRTWLLVVVVTLFLSLAAREPAAMAAHPKIADRTHYPVSSSGSQSPSTTPRSSVQSQDACPEPNDTSQLACTLSTTAAISGILSDPTDVDIYRIEALAFGTGVHVDVDVEGDAGAAPQAQIVDWRDAVLATSGASGDGSVSIDTTVNLPGAYFIVIRSSASESNSPQAYRLRRSLTYASSMPPKVLFSTEFREGSRRATTGETEFAVHTETDGRYAIAMKVSGHGTNRDPAQAWWTGFGPELDDFVMSVDTKVENHVDAGLRIFFRHISNGNTYAFEVRSGTGETVLLKMVDGQPVGIAWYTATAIDTAGGVNRVVITARGEHIRINVNGEEVFDRSDGSFSKGRIGLGALTYGPPPTVRFDNVLVSTVSSPGQ